MSRILMVSSEAAPYAKTGGLADVVGALPAALQQLGHEVAVLIPRYAGTVARSPRQVTDPFVVQLGPYAWRPSVYTTAEDSPFFFLDLPEFYARDGIYGDRRGEFGDNDLRFGMLSLAVFEFARRMFRPDIIHCHDWQAGLTPCYLKTWLTQEPTFYKTKSIETIHNLGYLGYFGRGSLERVGLPPWLFRTDLVEFYGGISLLKAGLVYADAITTVSPRYAQEIQTPEHGYGLDGLLRSRSQDLIGILNGVDYSTWNPETDTAIPANYSAADLSGKAVCKRELLREFGLEHAPLDRPLVGIVSRLAGQKGSDLILDAAPALFREDLSMVVLGSGEPSFEQMFRQIRDAFPERVGLRLGYDDGLAHRIEAGSDMFLMPSRYEPCGLNQIYSLRYGTVPVVRATGGLDDTIDGETGFKFWEYSGYALLLAMQAALRAWNDRERWTRMMRTGMGRDFSWMASAVQYSTLYERLLNP
jgi:starch synthase